MPFGPFEDFADCVAKHQEATNPEALCAFLHHKITGKWPAEASEHGEERLNLLDRQINSLFEGFRFQFPPTKTLAGVEVFAVGDWRDSKGRALKVTPGDLAKMVKAEGEIPLKVGHTSPEFNRRVAAALGVPVEMLTGEGGGKGQMALGRVARLTIAGNKLLADFEGVPGPLADLVEAGQYSSISSELDMDAESHPIRLTGVALLGVEKPAIATLKGLEAVAIFSGQEGGPRFLFSRRTKEDRMPITKESVIRDVVAMFQEGAGDALTAIAVALGLDPNNATLAAVLKAIEGLKAGGAPVPEGEEMAKQNAEFADLRSKVKTQEALLSQYERERRVARFQKVAEGWKALPGKPTEIAEKLANIEEQAGSEAAGMVVAQFQAANLAVEGAGLLVPIGRGAPPVNSADPFEKQVQARMAQDGVSFEIALSREATEDPRAFYAYKSRRDGS